MHRRQSIRLSLTALLVAVPTLLHADQDSSKSIAAGKLVVEALTALGGQSRLEGIKQIQFTAVRHSVQASIAPSQDPPLPIIYEKVTDRFDLPSRTLRENSRLMFTERPTENESTSFFTPEGAYSESAGKQSPASASSIYRAEDAFLSNPIMALLAALRDERARITQSDIITGLPCTWLDFSEGSVPVRVCIDRSHKLPLALEFERAYPQDVFTSMWGTFRTRYTFSGWALDSSGIVFPRKWGIDTGHGDIRQVSILSLTLNPGVSEVLDIPEPFKQAYVTTMHRTADDLAADNHGSDGVITVAEGIVMLPGKERKYNSVVVRQSDGVLIIEAPFSSSNSAWVRQQASMLFPGARIKAVISSSNLWIHAAGIAGYADGKIPIYVLDRNLDEARALLRSAPAHHVPIRIVKSKITIGSGTNRVVLIPYRGLASAGMMAAYFPEQKLLYASDMYQPVAFAGEYWSAHLAEAKGLIEREHLDVERIMGLHMPPADWHSVLQEIPH